jgi:hypothetical protein
MKKIFRQYDGRGKTLFPVYVGNLKAIDDLKEYKFPSKLFVLLLTGDFRRIENNKLIEIGRHLIDAGMVYFYAWGPDCDKAQVNVETASVVRDEELGNHFHVMTASHEREPFEDAVWFALFCAFPEDDELWENCTTVIATFGDKNLNLVLDRWLSDVPKFINNVLRTEDA